MLHFSVSFNTGKNNGFPILDILGYLKNTHKNPKFGRVRQIPIWELGWEFVSLSQIWDFCGYSLNTLKYPKLGIRWFFLCNWLTSARAKLSIQNHCHHANTKRLDLNETQKLHGLLSGIRDEPYKVIFRDCCHVEFSRFNYNKYVLNEIDRAHERGKVLKSKGTHTHTHSHPRA